jgi:hypothetical protein
VFECYDPLANLRRMEGVLAGRLTLEEALADDV